MPNGANQPTGGGEAMNDLYRGSLVRLSAFIPETMTKSILKWDRDSEAQRLANDSPSRMFSEKALKEMDEKREGADHLFRFAIHPLEHDVFIGMVSLWVASWSHAEAWLGILIGEREYWSRGYGSDAVRLAVQYGFLELNLRRISLGLHAFNERAFKSYQKVGFVLEGRERGILMREGARHDGLIMGILREDWMSARGES